MHVLLIPRVMLALSKVTKVNSQCRSLRTREKNVVVDSLPKELVE